MKQVLSKSPENTAVAYSCNCSDDKYYGISLKSQPKTPVGFVTREGFRRGNYLALAVNHLTEGNNYDAYRAERLEDFLNMLISNSRFLVYEFDSNRELFAWLANRS
jgi:hypothetical protein